LEFNKASVNDVVYVEGAVGNIYLESTTDPERYRKMFSRLEAIALSSKSNWSGPDTLSMSSGVTLKGACCGHGLTRMAVRKPPWAESGSARW
jgi:hypothetical protein